MPQSNTDWLAARLDELLIGELMEGMENFSEGKSDGDTSAASEAPRLYCSCLFCPGEPS